MKTSIKTFITSVMLVLSISQTFAAEVTYFPTVMHFQEKNRYGEDWNTKTNCVKLTLDNGLTFGTMSNSYHKQSTFAGYTARPLKIGNVSAGALFGVVSGYDSKMMALKVPLLGAGTILWQATKKHHVEVIVVPTVKQSSGFVSVGFGMSF